ncbi:ParB-like nuclease [Sulfitobacter noctilucae]|uniref:ParB/RepB/Spo0J family partition protein n=1 Tax=Sulfitobacter noctilucae TaxID=1342302 RepID=UPI0004682118|nr:ParB N-terminal domain-containing protein [Sulfitobacter noctilucae]KIN66207.1 ParB-like nuclease [Sulfitobacter noctilucae]
MAKRRKLETPTAETLGKIEEEFRRETPSRQMSAPIAQVAAEAAGSYQVGTPEMRRDEAQAAAFRVAEGQGRVILELQLDEIEPLSMQRDRTIMDDEALTELEDSIALNGLRLPIEVYKLKDPKGGKRYGLLSGYRRFLAQKNLAARAGGEGFARIKSLVRDPDQIGGAFAAMVEENEIRQDLSHYERGRIAVIAAQQGAFATTEDAVAGMFAAASKAKRSKIRSFALIFEELGDVLQFPESLREKDGLRLAQGLRAGAGTTLRDALGAGQGANARGEWAIIDRVLATQKTEPTDPRRGGRPKQKAVAGLRLEGRSGLVLEHRTDGKGHTIRLRGRDLSEDALTKALEAFLKSLDAEA